VAEALKPGGLYFLDWCVQFDIPLAWDKISWDMKEGNIKVTNTVGWKVISRVEQTVEEIITLEVDDNGEKHEITGTELKRAIYPQEFLLYIERHKNFEFVGWWNNWDMNVPLETVEKIDRPIVVIRRI